MGKVQWITAVALMLLGMTAMQAKAQLTTVDQWYAVEDTALVNSTSNIVLHGRDDAPAQTDDYLWNWAITTVPGHVSTNMDVVGGANAPTTNGIAWNGDFGLVALDQDDYDPIDPSTWYTAWGTYFTYVPVADWYGIDTFKAAGANSSGSQAPEHDFFVTVLNRQDKPQVDPVRVFILKCAADEGCNATNGSAPIVAIDRDNLGADKTAGLTYEFTDPTNELGQVTNELGYATLVNGTVSFVITNTAFSAPANAPAVTIGLRVTDTIVWTNGLDATQMVAANYENGSAYTMWQQLGYPTELFSQDYTNINAEIWWAPQNGAYFTDVDANLAHGELLAENYTLNTNTGNVTFAEGEACTFSLTANDSFTNNMAGLPVSCFGVTKVIWTLTPAVNSPMVVGETGVVAEVTAPIILDDGLSSLSTMYSIDTSSETFTNLPSSFTLEAAAVDYCGQTNAFTWQVHVRALLEYPLIDMPEISDQILGATWTTRINELNGNNQFVDLTFISNPPGLNDGLSWTNNADGTYTFTAVRTGCYTIYANVVNNDHVMIGYAMQTFCVLCPESKVDKAARTLVINGNDTNDFCYGQVTIETEDEFDDAIVEIGGVRYFRPDANVDFIAIASTTPEGADHTFLHWGPPTVLQDPTIILAALLSRVSPRMRMTWSTSAVSRRSSRRPR